MYCLDAVKKKKRKQDVISAYSVESRWRESGYFALGLSAGLSPNGSWWHPESDEYHFVTIVREDDWEAKNREKGGESDKKLYAATMRL